MRRALILGLGLLLGACEGVPGEASSDARTDGAVACAPGAREAGCECQVEGARARCVLSPRTDEATDLCHVGTATCRDGGWSACEDVRAISPEELAQEAARTLGVARAALVTGPTQCEACRPLCFEHADTPGPADLGGPNSEDLEYDPSEGGVVIESELPACAEPSCTVREPNGAGSTRPWTLDEEHSEGVIVDPSGALTLGVSRTLAPGVWIASMNDGTVSRLHPETGDEVGRYATARPSLANGARPWDEWCNWRDHGNCPSRTAVDQNFDVYVANRAFGNQGTVTKIAAREEDCRDRNGDGVIQTSRDVDGDGVIDMGAGSVEFFGPDDECILWTVPVGPLDGVPRALAVGRAAAAEGVGDVWVGLHESMQACRLDPLTGSTHECIGVAPVRPYGAVTDDRGHIWMSALSTDTGGAGATLLGHVDPATSTWTSASTSPAHTSAYGNTFWISADGARRYIFLGGMFTGDIARYDIDDDRWDVWTVRGLNLWPRAVAADEEHLWISTYCNNGDLGSTLIQVRIDDMSLVRSHTMVDTGCHSGVGVGFDGAVWVVSGTGERAARLSPDRLTQIQTPSLFVTPYTYSDFIGFGLNVFADPRGRHRFTTDAGDCDRYRWSHVELQTEQPTGTAVELYARVADSGTELARQAWVGPFAVPSGATSVDLSASPGPLPNGRLLELEVRLSSADRRITPRVLEVTPTGFCDRRVHEPEGSYNQTYDTRAVCLGTTAPSWGELEWDAQTPEGTRVVFEVRSADDPDHVDAATPIMIETPPAASPVDLSEAFASAGRFGMRVLSVRARLVASDDRRRSPVLHTFSVRYNCDPSE